MGLGGHDPKNQGGREGGKERGDKYFLDLWDPSGSSSNTSSSCSSYSSSSSSNSSGFRLKEEEEGREG